ncbi:MAG: hypothetical protein Q8M22_13595 [Actinomycetota bacterium]|nr:hypothetical protein [Actinomycetota bacterium]
MNTTLLDYAHASFPGHETEVWDAGSDAELTLTSHTVVAHVVGEDAAAGVAATMHQHLTGARVAAVMVRPVEPTVVPDRHEDADGVFDLPHRRVGVAAALGAALGAAVGFVVGSVVSTTTAAFVLAFFGAAVGLALGAVSGGGARHASERAVSQPHAPGRTVAVVAAFLHDEAAASTLARAISDSDDEYDVRIVGADGAWHAPNN